MKQFQRKLTLDFRKLKNLQRLKFDFGLGF